MSRLRLAWRVWRSGLPVAEITWQELPDTVEVAVRYAGRCHGITDDGYNVWSDDGTFVVVLQRTPGGAT